MTTFGFCMILLGAGSLSVNLMRLFDRLDRPQPKRRTT